MVWFTPSHRFSRCERNLARPYFKNGGRYKSSWHLALLESIWLQICSFIFDFLGRKWFRCGPRGSQCYKKLLAICFCKHNDPHNIIICIIATYLKYECATAVIAITLIRISSDVASAVISLHWSSYPNSSLRYRFFFCAKSDQIIICTGMTRALLVRTMIRISFGVLCSKGVLTVRWAVIWKNIAPGPIMLVCFRQD